MQRGVRPTVQNKFFETPLFAAAETGNFDVVGLLSRQKDCKIDHQDKFGDTVLHFACRDGQEQITDYFIKKHKRLVKIKNQEGKTPMSYAMENGHLDCIGILR